MPSSSFRPRGFGAAGLGRDLRTHAFRPDDGRTGRDWTARANEGKVSRYARGHGYRGARYLGGAEGDSQRRLRLPAQAVRTGTIAQYRPARAGESPAEAGEPRLPDQP